MADFKSHKKNNTHKCLLDDGNIVDYDMCALNRNVYDSEVWQWIGEGVIHSIDGTRQQGVDKKHFFVEKS